MFDLSSQATETLLNHPVPTKSKGTILAVDDESTNLLIMSTILELEQYHVIQTSNAQHAWELLQSARDTIDVILLDRYMPEMNGLEFIEKMKSASDLQRIPVIMQTAGTAPTEVAEGIEAGVYYYLTKPYNQQALLSLVSAAHSDKLQKEKIRKNLSHFSGALQLMTESHFKLSTLDEAQALSTLLAHVFPNPEDAALGLSEIIINAIEHGNLGISYEEKTALNLSNRWLDEINHRLTLPEYRHKRVNVSLYRRDDAIEAHIMDQGAGFNWHSYLEIVPERLTDNHGRGIPIAKHICFDSLEYVGNGNHVICRTKLN